MTAAESEKIGYRRVLLLLLLGCCYAIVAVNHTLPTFHGYTPHFFCQVDNVTASAGGCVKQLNSTGKQPEASCPRGYQFQSDREDVTVATEWQLVCERRALRPLVATLYFCGVTLGAIVCGMLADKYGRRPLLLTCVYAQGLLGVALYFAEALEVFMGIRFIQGFFVQGVQGTSYALLVELFPPRFRTAVGVVLELYWAAGLVYLATASYYIPQWRLLEMAISVPSAVTLLYMCFVPESPRWLAACGRHSEAQEIWDRILPRNKNRDTDSIKLNLIADTTATDHNNKIQAADIIDVEKELRTRPATDSREKNMNADNVDKMKSCDSDIPEAEKSVLPDTSDKTCKEESEEETEKHGCVKEGLKDEFVNVNLEDSGVTNSKQFLVTLNIATDKCGIVVRKTENGFASRLNPGTTKKTGVLELFRSRVLRKHNLIMVYVWFSVSLSYYGIMFHLPDLSGERHLNFLIGAIIEVIAYILAYFIVSRFGRRRPMCSYLFISGAICITVVPEEDAFWIGPTQTALVLLGKGAVVSGFYTMFLYSSELFPTVLRAAAMGHCGLWGRVGSLLAPQLLFLGEYTLPAVPILVMGVVGMVGGLLVLALPETMGQQLPDTVQDAEVLARSKRLTSQVAT